MTRNNVSAAMGVIGAIGFVLSTGIGWATPITIETVPVANIDNAPDATGYGQVSYAYSIGEYEVTAGQYTAFLNAVAGVDTYNVYNTQMARTDYGSGIARSGSGTAGDPYVYAVDVNFSNRPVNYVSFWDACRFANWLDNGQPSGAQDASTTEEGAYTLTPAGISANTITRNPGAVWAVTSEDEWYKAAHYNPVAGSYYLYATSNNSLPGRDLTDGSGNNANYQGNPYPIQSPYFTTVVGEFQNSQSPYGTFDQAGNLREYNESILFTWYRGVRGGSFANSYLYLPATDREYADPPGGSYDLGFRVALVPEPVALAILALAVAGASLRHRQKN